MDYLLNTAWVALAVMAYLILVRRSVVSALSHPERFPTTIWRWPEAIYTVSVVMFFLLMAASSFGKAPSRVNLEALKSSFILYSAIILFVVGYLVYRNVDLMEAFGLQGGKWVRGLPAMFIGLSLVLPPIYGAQWLGYSLAGPDAEPQPIVTFLMNAHGWQSRLAVIGIAVIAAPLTEELIFRGCLYGIVRQIGGRYSAMAVSAIVFALIHGHIPSIPGLVILAVALALLYEQTGSLWAPISMHAAFNAASIFGTIMWPDAMK